MTITSKILLILQLLLGVCRVSEVCFVHFADRGACSKFDCMGMRAQWLEVCQELGMWAFKGLDG